MSASSRLILGIDPGTASTGYGVIVQSGNRLELVEYGVVRTEAGEELSGRLQQIFAAVGEILRRHQAVEAAVESLFFNVNVRTAFAVGQARGVALLACAQSGCEVHEYTPQEVKQAVVGYGKADKVQVQEMVRVLLRLTDPPKPDHASDALAVAICHAHGRSLRARIERRSGRAVDRVGRGIAESRGLPTRRREGA